MTAWRIASALMLTTVLGGCHPFEHDWDSSSNTPPSGLAGRWEGTWTSDANGHTGGLRAIITAKPDGKYHVQYHATYKLVLLPLQFGMDIDMSPTKIGDHWEFAGEEDLGCCLGKYTYKGHATDKEFVSNYDTKFDRGTFRMARPVRDASEKRSASAPTLLGSVADQFVLCADVSPSSDKPEIGKPASAPALKDLVSSKDVRLSDFAGKTVVVCFQAVVCGVVDRHQKPLAELAAHYADKGVVVLTVFSNDGETEAEIRDFAKEKKLAYPVLRDAGHVWADRFGATHTPQFLVIDAKGVWRYSGAFRDNAGEAHYLTDALEAVLAGKEPPVAKTKAYGCKIDRKEK